MSTAAQRFHENYITSSEILNTLEISRTSLSLARKAGKLPGGIEINGGQIIVWERSAVQDYVKAWKQILLTRRAHNSSGAIAA